MKKILMTSFMCFSFLASSTLAIAQCGDNKQKTETKKEKKECKNQSCKKPKK